MDTDPLGGGHFGCPQPRRVSRSLGRMTPTRLVVGELQERVQWGPCGGRSRTGISSVAELVKTRILVADDDQDILDLVGFILTHAGYEVVNVTDGSEAIAALEADPPGLAILDVMMPGLSGIEVLRRVRKNDSIKNMQVILLTVQASDSDVAAGFAAGASDYVTKPVILSELLRTVKSLLAQENT